MAVEHWHVRAADRCDIKFVNSMVCVCRAAWGCMCTDRQSGKSNSMAILKGSEYHSRQDCETSGLRKTAADTTVRER